MARKLLAIVVISAVLGACGQAADAHGAVDVLPAAAVATPPVAGITIAPSATRAAIPRKLTPVARPPWLSTDAAYLRLRPDGQADLWVRFSTATNAAAGFVDIYATLFSASGPIGEPVQAAAVYLTGRTLPHADDWLQATIPMSDAAFASVTRVSLTQITPPKPTAFRTATYAASNVKAVREPDGSVTVTGTLDGNLAGVDAKGSLAASLAFVVLDRAGAPLGGFGTSVAALVKGTRVFNHAPFSVNSLAPIASFPSLILPGDIATVQVFTLLND